LLPSFLWKRHSAVGSSKGKRPRTKVYTLDRTIILLPQMSHTHGGEIQIPRGPSREKLGRQGLIGKIRLTTDMNEDEIYKEIWSVFSKPMGENSQFPFQVLQPAGSGCKTLALPPVSSSFTWTAREIAGSSRSTIYILAGADLVVPEREEVSECFSAWHCIICKQCGCYMCPYMYGLTVRTHFGAYATLL